MAFPCDSLAQQFDYLLSDFWPFTLGDPRVFSTDEKNIPVTSDVGLPVVRVRRMRDVLVGLLARRANTLRFFGVARGSPYLEWHEKPYRFVLLRRLV
jgi:hypothetical protein